MASIADTDSLSGFEPLDSTATSLLLNAAPIATHPDRLSPASQLSSLRASMAQSGALLKGSDGDISRGNSVEASPEFTIPGSNASALTQSSLERHNLSHMSLSSSVDAVGQTQLRPHADDSGAHRDLRAIGLSSLPATPYSSRPADLHPQRLLATADHKHQPPPPKTLQASGTRQELPTHQTVPANRQLFGNQSTVTSSAHNSLSTSLLQSRDASQTAAVHNGVDVHQAGQRSRKKTADSRDGRTHQNNRQDLHQMSMTVTSEFQEMDKVRRSLYHMVHSAANRQERDSLESKESVGELLATHWSNTQNGFIPRESFESTKTDSLLGPHAYQDVSPLAMDSGLGQSSLRHSSSRDSTLFAENHMLKDSLERERYRRKHCEKQISEVQANLLETQQQLAVAISTDRKKDAMIEQLDKTLARIVDGWRRQEQDKSEALDRLMAEKQELLGEMDQMKEVVQSHQAELEQTKERLGRELQQAMQSQQDTGSQLVSLQEELSEVRGQLASEQKLTAQARQRRDDMAEERHRLDKQVKQVQHMLAEERQQTQSARREFQDRIQQFEKDNLQLVERQKAQIAAEARTSDLLEARRQEVDKLKSDLQDAVRDKENARLELTLQQAKSEAAQQKQEAEWQERLEELVGERLQALQSRSSAAEAELREAHRKQLGELHDQHQSQLLSQRAAYARDLDQRDQKIQEQARHYQSRLEQHLQDMSRMTQRLEKAQQQRALLVQQLQGVQVYCTDALSQMTHASPLVKVIRSGMDEVAVAGPDSSAPARRSKAERTRGTRPQHSPITISVSPSHRGVGVGAGILEESKQEHEDGDGQEDETFLFPNLSLATSKAPYSPPSNDPFTLHTDTSLFQEGVPVSLSQYFPEQDPLDDRVEGFGLPGYEQAQTAGSQSQEDNASMPSRASNPEEYAATSSSSHRIQPPPQGVQYFTVSKLEADPQKTATVGPPFNPVSNPVIMPQGKQGLIQSFQYYSGSRSDSTPAEEPKQGKETTAKHYHHSVNPPPSHSKHSASTLNSKQGPVHDVEYLSGVRPDAAPARDPGLCSSSSEPILSQDLISEGLRLLQMSPPSSHSSPLADAHNSLGGLTLGEVLRVTGRGWDSLGLETRHNRHEDYTDFREIQPSLDNTKTTNSVAVDASEDETVSEVESGSIHTDRSHVLLERLAEHKHRQMALQHYIQMLLQQPPAVPPGDPASSGPAVTKETTGVARETAGIANHTGGGMTTWHEQPPRGTKRVPPDSTSTRHAHPTNPRASQVAAAQGNPNPRASQVAAVQGNPNPRASQVAAVQGNPNPARPEQKSKVNVVSGTGPRQTTDRQASTAKPKGLTTIPTNTAKIQRHAQKTTASSAKTSRPATTSSATAQRKVVRKGAVRN